MRLFAGIVVPPPLARLTPGRLLESHFGEPISSPSPARTGARARHQAARPTVKKEVRTKKKSGSVMKESGESGSAKRSIRSRSRGAR